MVLTFAVPVTFTGASVTSGTGTVTGTGGSGTSEATINLTGVTDQQNITVSLLGASAGGASADIPVPIGVLLADVNASKRVDSGDVSLVRQQALQTITTSNFQEDINTSGRIDAGDVSLARQNALHTIP